MDKRMVLRSDNDELNNVDQYVNIAYRWSYLYYSMAIQWAIPIIIRTPPPPPPPPLLRNLGISRGGGALTLEFPGERVH
jgi:hypothetical protein